MEDTVKVKNTPVKQYFFDMNYDQIKEKLDEATAWFNKRDKQFFAYIDGPNEKPTGVPKDILSSLNKNEIIFTVYNPENVTVDNILQKCKNSKTKWVDMTPMERARILNLFAKRVEKNSQLFAQIDIASRGFLSKDTNNVFPILIQYLQYYASFGNNYYTQNLSWKPKGLSVALIPDESPVYIFGMFLGPTLAAGYNVILQTGAKITPVATLIVDLAVLAGIPEGVIRLVPGEVGIEIFFTSNHVETVTCFDDLYKEKYNICNTNFKHLVTFSAYQIPMLVFENCDLDAACHTLIRSAWSHQGMLPYAIGDVLVQENVFQTFLTKLKQHLQKLSVGQADDKLADVPFLSDASLIENYNKALIAASDLGIEIFRTKHIDENCTPTLFIGGKIHPNNVIQENKNIPAVTVLAFRTINEAVTLANNTRQGFGAVVMAENISLVYEVVKKIKVSNIWVNCCGTISPDVPFSAYKSSGPGYFGGKEGFYEYVDLKSLQNSEEKSAFIDNMDGAGFENIVAQAKKAFASWSQLTRTSRCRKVDDIIEKIHSQKTSSDDNKKKILDSWINIFYQAISGSSFPNYTSSTNYNVSSYREPLGVIVVEVRENDVNAKRLIAAALIEGNAVIVIDSTKDTFYNDLAKLLPSGILDVVSHSSNAVKAAALHKEIDAYFGEVVNKVFASLPLKDMRKFQVIPENSESVTRQITLIKNMWASLGQSFI